MVNFHEDCLDKIIHYLNCNNSLVIFDKVGDREPIARPSVLYTAEAFNQYASCLGDASKLLNLVSEKVPHSSFQYRSGFQPGLCRLAQCGVLSENSG